jgi:drug/metabolite transporter (DMT)-like permease
MILNIYMIYALIAAICVGTSDFLSRFTSGKYSSLYPAVWVTGIGSAFLAGILYFQGYEFFMLDNVTLGMMGIAGFLNLLSLILFYHALYRQPISIASPICTLSTAFLAIEWAIFGIELAMPVYIGMILSVSGAGLIGFFSDKTNATFTFKHNLITAMFALCAAVCFSLRLFILQHYVPTVGAAESLFYARFFSFFIAIIILIYCMKRNKIKLPKIRGFNLLHDGGIPIIQGLCETVGILLLLNASVGQYRVIAPAIFTCYCLVTIILSVIFLQERLKLGRIIAIFILLLGVVIMQIFGN